MYLKPQLLTASLNKLNVTKICENVLQRVSYSWHNLGPASYWLCLCNCN